MLYNVEISIEDANWDRERDKDGNLLPKHIYFHDVHTEVNTIAEGIAAGIREIEAEKGAKLRFTKWDRPATLLFDECGCEENDVNCGAKDCSGKQPNPPPPGQTEQDK